MIDRSWCGFGSGGLSPGHPWAAVAAQEIPAKRSISGSRGLMLEVPPETIDALDQSLQQAAAEHEGAAVANKRKRYTFDRHQADGHGDVDEHMHGHEHRDAERQ